jgi:hypothetical protein
MFGVRCWLLVVHFSALCLSASAALDLSQLPPPATKPVDFVTDIQPIIEQSC